MYESEAGPGATDHARLKKGQVWSTDFAVSAAIFVTMIALMLFVFNATSRDASNQADLSDMQNRGLEATEAIVRTPGYPPDWNPGNVQVLGLAYQENSLDNSKVISFLGMDYSSSKTALGIPNYEYNFTIENLNRAAFYLEGQKVEKGLPPTTAKDILSVERYVLINGQIKRLRLIVWR